MAKAKLTQAFLAGIKPDRERKRVRYWDTEIPGFFASVLQSGRITFYLKYRFEGVPREFPLGVYGAITVAQAKTLTRKTAGEVAAGRDPHAERKQRKAERLRQRQATLGAFVEKVYGPYLLAERKDGTAALARMKSCFEQWYALPMQDISEFRVMRWRQEELRRGLANSSINRSVSLLKACLN